MFPLVTATEISSEGEAAANRQVLAAGEFTATRKMLIRK